MVRNVLLRVPLIRGLVPRISRPILPLAARLTRPPTASRPFHHLPARLFSPPPSPTDSNSPKIPPNATLSQRLKHLIKAYGWYALGVYLVLSALDFSVAFAAVNVLGAEHVSRVAASVKEFFIDFLPSKPPEPGREEMDSASSHAGGHEGLYAMIVLAYTIHKTLFLPVRVGLTAGLTPKLVHWLRARGWAGGAGTKRAVQEMKDKMRERR